MAKLSRQGQKWLKCFHIYSACVWIGCATVLSIMTLTVKAESGAELYGILATLDFIDLYILVPGALGIFFPGIIYSAWKNRGWFKHNLNIVKWLICIFGILFGKFRPGPWLSEMVIIAKNKRYARAFRPETYISNRETF